MTGILAAMLKSAAGSGGALAVTANNVTRTASGDAPSGIVTTVQSPNTTITGGTGPYTRLWEYVSGSTIPQPDDDTALNPQWSGEVENGTPEVAVWRITATDALSAEATDEITVTLNWVNTGSEL